MPLCVEAVFRHRESKRKPCDSRESDPSLQSVCLMHAYLFQLCSMPELPASARWTLSQPAFICFLEVFILQTFGFLA